MNHDLIKKILKDMNCAFQSNSKIEKDVLENFINGLISAADLDKVRIRSDKTYPCVKQRLNIEQKPVERRCPETCETIRNFFNECYELFLAKQQDRGPGNISEFGRKGIVLRMCDKYSRIKRIIWDEIHPEVSEPVENEYKDMAVYSAIDYTLSKNKWGK